MWINPEKKQKGMKLDLGSGNPEEGEIQPEGYVLNDISPHKNIDLVCNIMHLDKFIDSNFCSEIRASHVLEHFTRKELDFVISLVYRLLEKGGIFRIAVPNFVYHAQLLMEGNDEMAVTYAYGGQRDEFDIHKNAFTNHTLSKVLRDHGFIIKSMLVRQSLACEAIK